MQTIREVMTKDPIVLPPDVSVAEAARRMRDADIGCVLVRDNDRLSGILTDRDIVLRAVAEDLDLEDTKVAQLCTSELMTTKPDDSVEQVIDLMRQRAIRRVPVVENDQPVGIVSLGDLAIRRDQSSVLGQISSAPPRN